MNQTTPIDDREALGLPPTIEQMTLLQGTTQSSQQLPARSRLARFNFFAAALLNLVLIFKFLLGLLAGMLCLFGAFLVLRRHAPGDLKYALFALVFGLAVTGASVSMLRDLIPRLKSSSSDRS